MANLLNLPRRLTDPRYWKKDMAPGEKLQRLAILCPKDFQAIMTFVDHALKRYYKDNRHRSTIERHLNRLLLVLVLLEI